MKSLLLAAAVVMIAVSGFARQQPAPASEKRASLPAIKLQDLNGNPVSGDKLKGSVIVLDFWATWCGPCIVEIPHYNKLQEKYVSKGVKVVGITMASGEAKEVKPFVTRHNMKYAVYMGDDDQAHDFNIIGFPTTYLVTRDWKIYKRYVGAGPRKIEQLEKDIDELLATYNN